jgi:hypothetical protein
MFLNASHSAKKLFEAANWSSLNTLMAIVSTPNWPLYTNPNLPEPTTLAKEKPFVALNKSLYDSTLHHFNDWVIGRLVAPLFFRRMNPRHVKVSRTTIISGTTIVRTYDVFFVFEGNSAQSGTCCIGDLAHNFLFPWMDRAVELAKTPPLGTGPSSSLKDKLRICKEVNDSKKSGIVPYNLF